MYPILLKLKNKKILVVGGGKIAERKVIRLLKAEANILLVSPDITDSLQKFVDEKKIVYNKRKFTKGDLKNAFLVIAATNDKKVNHLIFRESEKNKILVNVIDEPDYCNFYVPSVIDRGDLLVAISTKGKSPAFARILRKKLEEYLPDELSKEVALLGDLREEQKSKNAEEREKIAKRQAQKILDFYFKD
ncbi:MAG: precorrin-2 dehydrogenase/sirohydrochlorin ferrochelatase family protein [Candidatus Humimicrobiaceae bacterium]